MRNAACANQGKLIHIGPHTSGKSAACVVVARSDCTVCDGGIRQDKAHLKRHHDTSIYIIQCLNYTVYSLSTNENCTIPKLRYV